ncbi:transporter [Streptomyces sp. NRRL F-4489]|uniref:MFS transporter n=1 Tax=Streptomyces sp. NRRL F-4489 TaxID=1609095 RepID=UPI000748F8E0|nr:transporter [Streptomyces sp. NRRL F-4489]
MTTGTTAPPLLGERSPARGWGAVLAVALGIFALMTSELLPVGLLTPVGAALAVPEGTAGLMVTVPGLVAAVAAPLVTVATGRLDRRLVLVLLIGLVGAANLVSALAGHFAVVLAARVLVGVGVGGFWSLAGGLAVRMVEPRRVARATAVIFAGVQTASVLGVPAGTLLGDLAGRRAAFAAVGGLGLLAAAGLAVLLPALPPEHAPTLRALPRALRSHPALRTGLALTFLVVTGHFLAYTFVRPVLHDRGTAEELTGLALLAFGAAGICGNFAAGALAGRRPRATAAGLAAVLAVAPAALAATGRGTAGTLALLVLWGLGYGAVSVTFQTWTMRAAPAAGEAASALYVAVFNVSIALGALSGGVLVDALPVASALWSGAALALAALATVAATSYGGRRAVAKTAADARSDR